MSESEVVEEVKVPDLPKVERDITVLGRKDGPHACKYCKAADTEIPRAIEEAKAKGSNTKFNYKFIDIDSDAGQQIIKDEGLDPEEGFGMPIIKDCTKKEGQEASCKVKEGYDDRDWYDLSDI